MFAISLLAEDGNVESIDGSSETGKILFKQSDSITYHYALGIKEEDEKIREANAGQFKDV